MYRVRHQIGYDMHFFGRENPDNYAVAIVDSGIVRHPDLMEQVIAFYDFSSEKYKDLADCFGHGTHVAGCLAGNGALSKGRYQGICPKAKLVILKVLDKNGLGDAKWLIEALKYILKHHQMYHIKVVNLSLGVEKSVSAESLCIIQKLILEIIGRGIFVVCAAGNYGPSNNSIYGIGKMKDVITVGCYDGIYERGNPGCCRSFSGRGDKAGSIIKPDIVAPGTQIISCSNRLKKAGNKAYRNAYEEKSGTSMSAPIISGIILGILLNKPEVSIEELKRVLLNSATDVGLDKNMQGHGFINCKKISAHYNFFR